MISLLANRLGNDPIQGVGDIGAIKGGGIVFTADPKLATFAMFRDVLSLAIGVMTVVGFVWFFFMLIGAAISWLSSGGEKNKIQEAQKRLTSSIIGLILLVSSTFLIRILEIVLGIDILSGIRDLLFKI